VQKDPYWVGLIMVYDGCDHTTNEFVGILSFSWEL
jgi:hypothetical protein